MPDVTIPNSSSLREGNNCHNPGGSPVGGRFCSKDGGPGTGGGTATTTVPQAKSRAGRIKFETHVCSRCSGTGNFGPASVWGGTCFGCSGGGKLRTKAAHKAADVLTQKRDEFSKRIEDFKVGEPLYTAADGWRRITKIDRLPSGIVRVEFDKAGRGLPEHGISGLKVAEYPIGERVFRRRPNDAEYQQILDVARKQPGVIVDGALVLPPPKNPVRVAASAKAAATRATTKIAALKAAAQPMTTINGSDLTIGEDGRITVKFGRFPKEATRSRMRDLGMRWNPANKTWWTQPKTAKIVLSRADRIRNILQDTA